MAGEGSSPPFRQSPYSPFPFGSPLGMTDRSVTSASNGRPRGGLNLGTSSMSAIASASALSNTFSNSLLKCGGRVRVQEAYGGPVMFGGNASSSRKSRIFAASPYAAAAAASRKPHQRPLFDESTSRRGSSAAATPSPAPSPSPSSTTSENGVMSTTARLIFDTLEKMSTPIRDAQKLIPSVNCSPPRAEKRRAIAEQLDWSHGSLKRRRPQLGNTIAENSGQLNGPPLRTVFSPVSASPRSKSTATKSARISLLSAGANHTLDKGRPNPGSPYSSPKSYSSNPMPSVSKTTTTSSTSLSSKTKANGMMSFTKTADSPNFGVGVWSSPSASNQNNSSVDSTTIGGKIRAKIGEPKHFKATSMPKTVTEEDEDPLPAFLASHNNALPIKTMPSFNFNQNTNVATNSPPLSRGSSTASTLPLSQMSRQSSIIIDHGLQNAPLTASTSFLFSEPSEVEETTSRPNVEAPEANYSFTFCHPEEVASGSPNTSDLMTSPVRNTTLITTNNHRTLPDLTMRSPLGGNNIFSAPKSLKPGSVMDILGRNHLPDVTASTGIKAAPELKNDSVMSILGSRK